MERKQTDQVGRCRRECTHSDEARAWRSCIHTPHPETQGTCGGAETDRQRCYRGVAQQVLCLLPHMAVERPVFDKALPKGALGLQEGSSAYQHMAACNRITIEFATGSG